MSVKLLAGDAKLLLRQKAEELRSLVRRAENLGTFLSSELLSQSIDAEKLIAEIDAALRQLDMWDRADIDPGLFTAPAPTLKTIFGRKIDGMILLCGNAFFQVNGPYSEEEAKLLVREKFREFRSKVETLPSWTSTPSNVAATSSKSKQGHSEPATEKQKEKLRYFGYKWEEPITKEQASDAIDECVRQFPDVDRAYYNRPAVEEQLARLREISSYPSNDPNNPDNDPEPYYDPTQPLTYGQAKDLIRDWELWERQQIESSDLTDCADSYWEKHHWDDDYEESERGQFDQACFEILDGWQFKFGDLPTREQVANAWEIMKSRKSNKSSFPTHAELIAALAELSPKFKS
jgi:hypothetical protein